LQTLFGIGCQLGKGINVNAQDGSKIWCDGY